MYYQQGQVPFKNVSSTDPRQYQQHPYQTQQPQQQQTTAQAGLAQPMYQSTAAHGQQFLAQGTQAYRQMPSGTQTAAAAAATYGSPVVGTPYVNQMGTTHMFDGTHQQSQIDSSFVSIYSIV